MTSTNLGCATEGDTPDEYPEDTTHEADDDYICWLVNQFDRFTDEALVAEIQGDPVAAMDNYRRFAEYVRRQESK